MLHKLYSFFSHIPLIMLKKELSKPVFSRGKPVDLKEILKSIFEPYLKLYRLEHIELDEVLYSYELKGGVRVKIGSVKSDVYYVVEEPLHNVEDYDRVVSKIVENTLTKGSNTVYKRFVGWNINDQEDYLYFKILSGLGPLAPLVLDPYIEDIYLSQNVGRAYVVHNKLPGSGWIKTNIVVDPILVDRIVLSISRRIGKHISLVNPLAEGTYEGSIRVSLVYGDVVSRTGSSVVIRKKGAFVWTITKLIDEGVLNPLVAAYLWLVLEEKGWIVIAGHVGAGKTTFLQALLTLIPPWRKVIVIEDVPELMGSTGLLEHLVEKVEVFSGKTQIDSYTLLKFAMRRRPDYIVIGEVRGIEARLLVQASRLGHGVLNTIHADTPESVIKRLIAPPISIPKSLLNNIWTIVVVSADPAGRKVKTVAEVNEDAELTYVISESLRVSSVEDIVSSSMRLKSRWSRDALVAEISRRSEFLQNLVHRGVFDVITMSEELAKFYSKEVDAIASNNRSGITYII